MTFIKFHKLHSSFPEIQPLQYFFIIISKYKRKKSSPPLHTGRVFQGLQRVWEASLDALDAIWSTQDYKQSQWELQVLNTAWERKKKNIKGKKKSPITSNSEQPNAEAHNHVSLLKTYLYKSLRAIREGEKLVLRSFRSGFYRTFESRT